MNQLRLKGYVHNVTQTMQSSSGSTNYFNFSLQVTPANGEPFVTILTSKASSETSKTSDDQSVFSTSQKSQVFSTPNISAMHFSQRLPAILTPRYTSPYETWKHQLLRLKDFTPLLLEMFSHSSTDVNLQSSQKKIYEQLFQLRNITLHCSNTSES